MRTGPFRTSPYAAGNTPWRENGTCRVPASATVRVRPVWPFVRARRIRMSPPTSRGSGRAPRRDDCLTLIELMTAATGESAAMWDPQPDRLRPAAATAVERPGDRPAVGRLQPAGPVVHALAWPSASGDRPGSLLARLGAGLIRAGRPASAPAGRYRSRRAARDDRASARFRWHALMRPASALVQRRRGVPLAVCPGPGRRHPAMGRDAEGRMRSAAWRVRRRTSRTSVPSMTSISTSTWARCGTKCGTSPTSPSRASCFGTSRRSWPMGRSSTG